MLFGALFDVEVLHDYWLNLGAVVHEALPSDRRRVVGRRYSSQEFVEVTPTERTRAVMSGHGMLFRARPNGFVVGVELEPASTVPRRPPSSGFMLTFAMRVTDPRFFNYTAGLSGAFQRFGNDSGNAHASERFLSLPVPGHDPARSYQAGELRAQQAGAVTNLFQARADTGPGALATADWRRIPEDTHDPAATYLQGDVVLAGNELYRALVNGPGADLTVATEWQKEGSLANQYVTAADALRLYPEVFSVDVVSAAATVLSLRIKGAAATEPAWERRFEAAQQLTSLQADLRGLEDGRYRLEVLDAASAVLPNLSFDFYLSSRATYEKWFGVIEIGAASGSFALLDSAGKLRSPRYTLRFPNQASRWRYLFPRPQPIGTGAGVVVDPADDRILVTPVPLPLTRFGSGVPLRADDSMTANVFERILLPRPTAGVLRKQNNQWFSEVHMSNYPKLN